MLKRVYSMKTQKMEKKNTTVKAKDTMAKKKA